MSITPLGSFAKGCVHIFVTIETLTTTADENSSSIRRYDSMRGFYSSLHLLVRRVLYFVHLVCCAGKEQGEIIVCTNLFGKMVSNSTLVSS